MAKKQTKVNPETELVENDTVETAEATVKIVEGKVANCSRLNVRKKPALTAEPIAVVEASSALTIDEEKSTPDWYKVTLSNGKSGYCMRQYVVLT